MKPVDYLESKSDKFETDSFGYKATIKRSKLNFEDYDTVKGFPLSLNLEAKSVQATGLIDDLSRRIRGTNSGPYKPLKTATAAIVADLLVGIASDLERYGYRATGTDTFTGKRIGIRPFNRATQGMATLGYLMIAVGRKSPVGAATGTATRFALTPAFLEHAASFGIEPPNVWDHFAYIAPPSKVRQPIVCKTASIRNYALQTKTAGKSIPVDYASARAREAAFFVQEFNAFAAKHELNFPFEGFNRIFNNADQPGFDFDEGGRLYAINGSYQVCPRTSSNPMRLSRSTMTIDGHKTGEMDIGASHYTIASSYAGLPIDSHVDPYNVPGFPRCIIKAWVNASLGHGKPLERWPKHLIDDYAAPDKPDKPNRYKSDILGSPFPYTGDLKRDYPIRSILSDVAPRFHVIDRMQAMNKDWAYLQYRESCIIVDTLSDLMRNYGILALPVHDSLIYKTQDKEIVRERFDYWFHRNTGLHPRLAMK